MKNQYDPVFEHEVFIDTIRSNDEGLYDYGSSIYEFRDIDGDGVKEVLFSVRSYYTHIPRKVGFYNIENQKLTYSENFAAKGDIKLLTYNQGNPVFLAHTTGHANIQDPNPYYGSDFMSQLFLLNKDFEVIKGPVTYSRYHSSKYHALLPEKKQIFTISIPGKTENNKTRVYARLFDYQLNLIKENSFLLPFKSLAPAKLVYGNNVAYGTKNKFFVIDHKTLQHSKTLEFDIPLGRKRIFLNLDKDSLHEIAGINSTHIYVIEDDMKTVTTTPVTLTLDNKTYINKIPGKENKKRFLVQNQNKYAIYAYQENKAYVFQYPFYFLIYVLSAAFTYGITTITRRNAQKRYQLEREMLNLQLKSTRNQASPHFTYNLLNTISAAILSENKEKAHNMVSSMGQLMRSSLENSEQVERPLKEELQFVENYLSLEKQRFNSLLSYEIEVADDVNSDVPVPKMLLQIFAENAVKHGIKNLTDRKGYVTIKALKTHSNIRISVTDNGIGREAAKELNKETSKAGLKIVDKIIHLHKELNDQRILYEVQDLYDENNNPAGTKVTITIPINT
ncbi:MAG: histidine kinase [Bacteroidales bacterium]|nr:histidine kinase [Bacteroidales bacterium]